MTPDRLSEPHRQDAPTPSDAPAPAPAPAPAVAATMAAPPERRRRYSSKAQLSVLIPLAVVWLLAVAILAFVARRNDSGQLLVDPAYASGGEWYFGFVSNLGILAWAVAAVSAAWTGWLTNMDGRRRASTFLRHGAIVSTVLLVDDLFALHATVMTQIGIPKVVAEAGIAALVLGWLVKDWQEIRRTRYVVLVAALAANIMSLAVDVLSQPGVAEKSIVLEDGAKFLGILAWATYFVVTSRDISRSVLASWRYGQTAKVAAKQAAESGVATMMPLIAPPRPSSPSRFAPSVASAASSGTAVPGMPPARSTAPTPAPIPAPAAGPADGGTPAGSAVPEPDIWVDPYARPDAPVPVVTRPLPLETAAVIAPKNLRPDYEDTIVLQSGGPDSEPAGRRSRPESILEILERSGVLVPNGGAVGPADGR